DLQLELPVDRRERQPRFVERERRIADRLLAGNALKARGALALRVDLVELKRQGRREVVESIEKAADDAVARFVDAVQFAAGDLERAIVLDELDGGGGASVGGCVGGFDLAGGSLENEQLAADGDVDGADRIFSDRNVGDFRQSLQ